MAKFIPDSTGAVLVEVWLGVDDDPEQPWIERSPVIGWKITDDEYPDPEPVTIDMPPRRATTGGWFLELPETYGPQRWVFPEDQRLGSFDEAVELIVHRWKVALAEKRAKVEAAAARDQPAIPAAEKEARS